MENKQYKHLLFRILIFMNFQKRKIEFLVLTIIFISAIFFSVRLLAYDETIVHPSLTEEMARLYNRSFDLKLTVAEIAWLKQGSIDEDKIWGGAKIIRSSHHFYSPYGLNEWQDENLDQKIPAYFSSGIGPITSKKWAHNSVEQSLYAGGIYTWEQALWDYAHGDKQHAYESLGHILHLIEDAAVPAHVRNDFHLSPKELEAYQNTIIIKNFVDYEPYETWTGQMAKAGQLNFAWADKLAQENKKPPVLSDLDAYFEAVAKYTADNFFSKDTIYAYSLPKKYTIEGLELLKNGKTEEFVYGLSENNQKYKLAKVISVINKETNKIERLVKNIRY